MGNEKLTTLARRLRPFFTNQVSSLISGGAVSEGPDIDLVPTSGGIQVGRGGDSILVFDSGGNPVSEFAATGTGLSLAVASLASGDELCLPYHINIVSTSGIVLPSGARMRDANLTFNCNGAAIKLATGCRLFHCSIVQNGTTGTIYGIQATGCGLDTSLQNVSVSARGAVTNIAIYAKGLALYDTPVLLECVGTAYDGTNNYGIYLEDWAIALHSDGEASGGSSVNFGLSGGSATLAAVPLFHACTGFSTGTSSYGGVIGSPNYVKMTSCSLIGQTGGMKIYSGGTLLSGNNYWNTLNNSGTLTYLQGDRGAYSVEDYHATDIEDAALTRHNPLPGAAGGIPYSDGTNWTRVALSSYLHNAVTLAADADTILGLSTQQITLDSQNANTVLAGPTSGAAADPAFRALVFADMPNPPTATITAGTTTLNNTHRTVLCNAVGGAITVNLPAVASSTNYRYDIKKIDSSAYTVTVDGNASETIDGQTTQVISFQWTSITIVCDGAGWYII